MIGRGISFWLCLVGAGVCAGCEPPELHGPTTDGNFFGRMADCAAYARDGWKAWGARSKCEGEVALDGMRLSERDARAAGAPRLGFVAGCDAGIRGLRFIAVEPPWIMQLCAHAVLDFCWNEKSGDWRDGFWRRQCTGDLGRRALERLKPAIQSPSSKVPALDHALLCSAAVRVAASCQPRAAEWVAPTCCGDSNVPDCKLLH